MESSIAEFLMRWIACELLPTLHPNATIASWLPLPLLILMTVVCLLPSAVGSQPSLSVPSCESSVDSINSLLSP